MVRTAGARRVFVGGGGSSWKDPEKVGLYVALSLVYVVGLLLFQKATGLLELPRKEPPPVIGARTAAYSSEQGQLWLEKFQNDGTTGVLFRHLLQVDNGTTAAPKEPAEPEQDPLFPPDAFTKEQLRNGGVVCYMLGVLYMFVALAIVCDEFFVPALDVIIDKFGISEDVAGATFMAAGGSAPELFTAVIGVFVAFSDVGIGTVVGSAVFNILFVIGMCALFSKTVLHLTWWPLFRDCTFYSVSLITLILFFVDNFIMWWEALLLLFVYILYVIFMKFNAQAEKGVKRMLSSNRVTRVTSTDHLVPSHHSAAAALAGVTGGAMAGTTLADGGHRPSTGIPVLHSGSHFRHGLLQLMIHTIDPLHDGKVDEKATQLHAIASLKVLLDATKPQDGVNGSAGGHAEEGQANGSEEAGGKDGAGANPELEEVQPQPLDMSMPHDSCLKTLTYFVLLPIVFPLWLTLPDTRKQSARKFFPITFFGSIIWIALYSYLMVWWATVTGETIGIPPEVMGLTFLAAGTSIPDLITSVIVARKGFGDMAVSSSVGSNIFDVTVGLPLPWVLYTLFFQEPVPVSSEGMVCSIGMLFTMLCLVFTSILIAGWKMTKLMGVAMFVFYAVFVVCSLALTYGWVDCPLQI